jgi:hypothetical protein
MYKGLFFRVKNLIVSPAKEWQAIANEGHGINTILTLFSLPLMGMATLATFVGYLINQQAVYFDVALKHAAFTFAAFFFGLYAAYFLLLKVLPLAGVNQDKNWIFKWVAFPSLLIYLVHFVTALFSEFFFLRFLMLYTGFVVWEALPVSIHSPMKKRIYLTLLVTVTLLVLPYVFFSLMYKLSSF